MESSEQNQMDARLHSASKALAAPNEGIKRRLILTVSAMLLGALLTLGLLMYLAQSSLPGQRLYSFKTGVAEEAVAFTKRDAAAKNAYAVNRIERRLAELKTLASDDSTTTPETLAVVAALTDTHTKVVLETTDTTDSLSSEQKIDALAVLSNVTRAQESLVDSAEEFAPIRNTTSDIERAAAAALTTRIEDFASTSAPEAVRTYLGNQLSLVSADITKVANGSRAQNLTVQRINDANEAIADGNLTDALTYILRARQAIAVDGYLFEAERGPIDGQPIEVIEIPEGS